ncbi:S41 family peptidase [Pyxidicoccus fallax]|uniref:S41 family peptidase n=1 Tax=Pyxidicoccus fallax TaxID=394095 RepID=A0A848LMJ3_9BACT|nr:S41 family peptidase [Pyxidicoccus fallax]NMO18804.1 S41 family peptidase [Pyxidicoccus fallax]NPC84372.1 S41 family peptidase [Pyxidicoccus fallax]
MASLPRLLLIALLSVTRAALAAETPEQLALQGTAAAIAASPDDGSVLYNGACSAALAGRKAQALEWLARAVALDGVDAKRMAADPDLAALHGDPGWRPLLQVAQEAQARRERMWSSPALATPYRETLPEDERVAGLSKLWAEVKFNFVNFDRVPELDWDALYAQYLPRVRAARDTVAYYRELQSFASRLQDGHTGAFMPGEVFERVHARPGLTTLYLEGRVIVRAVFDERLRSLGIVPGWEIVTVEGQPVAEYAAAKVMPYFSWSTPQDKLSRAYERFLLDGPVDAAVKVGFKDARGALRELELPRMGVQARSAALPNAAPFEWKLLPGNIAYVVLRGFGDDRPAEAFEASFEQLSKADALILDIRDHGGGNTSVGLRILSTLTDKPFATTAWRTREYRPAYRAWGRGERSFRGEPKQVPPSGRFHYAKPVVMLTSPRTYSAGEDFAVVFDAMKRGTLIGEPTGGSTGQPLMISLPGGGSARICTKRDTYPDGREYVGVGVIPQVKVTPRLSDFRAGRDTVLDAAVRLLREKR